MALVAADRWILDSMPNLLLKELNSHSPTETASSLITAPVIILNGTIVGGEDQRRINRIQVIGVNERFWRLGGLETDPLPPTDPARSDDAQMIVNDRIAERLGVRPGDLALLRIEKPDVMPAEAPLSNIEDRTAAARLTIRSIAGASEFGHFGMQAQQVAPLNVYVPLEWLQRQMKRPGRVNAVLLGAPEESEDASFPDPAAIDEAIKRCWSLDDVELKWEILPEQNLVELRSGRIFIDPPVMDAVASVDRRALGVFTYFVNELRLGDRSVPYSMMSAVGYPFAGGDEPPLPNPLPVNIEPEKIVINQWLADQLQARIGDRIQIRYYVIGPLRKLEERTTERIVQSIVPLREFAADRTLMPDYPGISTADRCAEWEPGIPIDLDRIRPEDEAYWDRYRGTPKAFISLEDGRELWRNRFGELTALRFEPSTGAPLNQVVQDLAGRLRAQLDPRQFGLFFQNVRERALKAGREATDFGGLFVGFSFFLIGAAILLTALLFALGMDQRRAEIGILRAVGLTTPMIRRAWLIEGALIACLGVGIGALLGSFYTSAMIYGLTNFWSDAIGTTQLQPHVGMRSIALGMLVTLFIALASIWVMLRALGKIPIHLLLTGGASGVSPIGSFFPASKPRRSFLVGAVATVMALALMFAAGDIQAHPEIFLGAGAILLVAGMALSHWTLAALSGKTSEGIRSIAALAARNAGRRRGRGLAVIGMIAAGSFLVIAVGANRKSAIGDPFRRDSGTGGFAFYANTSLPVFQNLNSAEGREAYGLDAELLNGTHFLPFRVSEGDEASCLNLNRAQRPRLLGVDPESIDATNPFTFTRILDEALIEHPWRMLDSFSPGDVIPAIADQYTAMWALGLKLGDRMTLQDENGESFQIQIVGLLAHSIMQGGLIIGERDFIHRFPSAGGARLFLIDAPQARMHELNRTLSRSMERIGMDLTTTRERMADLNAVENAYLQIFLVLGALGIVLGCFGLGIVVLRNVMERRNEFAMMRAIGFGRGRIRRMILTENAFLLLMGLGWGVVSSLAALLPVLMQPGNETPLLAIVLLVATILASGLTWCWLAAWRAMRGVLAESLRTE